MKDIFRILALMAMILALQSCGRDGLPKPIPYQSPQMEKTQS